MTAIRSAGHLCVALLAVPFVAACKAPSAGRSEASAAAAVDAHFPPEAVDHLSMTVHADVEIFGIGKDKVELQGTVAVHRSGPVGAGGDEMVGCLLGASLRGDSDVFGEVIAWESPLEHSPCTYVWKGPGQYEGRFDIHGWFWLPEKDLLLKSAGAVTVKGTATAIPPVGQKAEVVKKNIGLQDLRKPGAQAVGEISTASGEIYAVVAVEEHLKQPEAPGR